LKTRIIELFLIRQSIIQSGMHYVGFAELAAAVSSAGGLGIITALTQRTPRCWPKAIRQYCRDVPLNRQFRGSGSLAHGCQRAGAPTPHVLPAAAVMRERRPRRGA